MQTQKTYTEDSTLERHVHALNTLLADAKPYDIDWCDQLIVLLEQVAEYSLHPGVPVRALSRTLQANADEVRSLAIV